MSIKKKVPGKLMTTSEVAKMLYVHINTVRRWSNKGILRSVRVGPRRDRRFARDEVKAMLRALQADTQQGMNVWRGPTDGGQDA